MAGASLKPDYYNKKVNLAFFLSPVTSMARTMMDLYDMLSDKNNRDILMNKTDIL